MNGRHVCGCAALLWTNWLLHAKWRPKKRWDCATHWRRLRLWFSARQIKVDWLCLQFEIRACWGHLSATAISQAYSLNPPLPIPAADAHKHTHTAGTQSGPISNSSYATAGDATRRNQTEAGVTWVRREAQQQLRFHSNQHPYFSLVSSCSLLWTLLCEKDRKCWGIYIRHSKRAHLKTFNSNKRGK